MNTSATRSWWESLRHFGLLLSPDVVNRIGNEYAPPELPWFRVDQLRRELNRREAGDVDAGQFVAWVLDKLSGFEGREGGWTRGSNVPPEWTQTLVTGEGLKPRHVWQGHRGGALPVFFDNAPVLGQHRGRKAISDCAQWLRKARRPLALVTNGRQWRLLFAGLDFEAACEWDTELWFEEGKPGPQLEALRTLLQPALVASPAKDAAPPLVTAIQDSRKGQSELSAFLGERVREAVEALVRGHGPGLARHAGGLAGADIYRAAVRVVMRMVVILFAESRELLPRTEPTYENGYGLQGLFEALQRVAVRGRGRLGQRFGAWPRALALFRLIYDGAAHPDLNVPAYGGELFAPGRADDADPVSRALAVLESACFDPELGLMPDSVVHEMLELLTRTQVRVRQGRTTTRTVVPVDFAGLSTEYIGVLYEGLLDYELRTAPDDDAVVFLAVGNEPALPLSALEAMDERQIRQLFEAMKETSSGDDGTGEDEGREEAAEETEGVEEEALEEDGAEESVEAETQEDAGEPSAAQAVRQRALTWTRQAAVAAGLVKRPQGRQTPERQQEFERKLDAKARQLAVRVVQPGEWFLVRWGGTRKGAGTFYTRPQLAVPTVHRTLQPLAYTPPEVDGKPDADAPPEAWRAKTPEEILALKVCDPSCGSGSFLVAAARFLTDALYQSLNEHGRLQGDWRRPLDELLGLSESTHSTTADDESVAVQRLPAPPDASDFEPRVKGRLRRYVVERCIYGVDLDPLAVELCRLALWLETMDRELPFSFLDHKVKCGNSLVGAWFDQFRHYPAMAWKNREGGDKTHGNGVHFEKDTRGKALKAFVKEVLTPDFVDSMTGQWKLDERPETEDPAAVHDEVLGVLEALHTMPAQDAAEQARRYREEFVGSETWRRLKAAFDLWCACWYWPADELEVAPLPSTVGRPDEATRAIATRVAARQRFFHWELEFPDVYRAEDSGFDAVLGNPPWETMQPSSHEFFSNIDPLYRSYGKQEALRKQQEYFDSKRVEEDWLDYSAGYADFSNWMKHAQNPWGDPEATERNQERFGLLRGAQNRELHADWRSRRAEDTGYADPEHPFRHRGEGKAYTYKLFLELAHAILREGGRLGFIVPSGLYSDHGTGALRTLMLDQCRWEWLFGFENREKVFDIDSRFKFSAVIVEKGGQTDAIRAAFMRRRLEDWEAAEAHVTPYERRQVERFSPKSRSILEIQSSRDLEILEKIYVNSVLLGDDGPEGWGIQYAQGDFNMTSDSALFPPRPQWEERGYKPDEYSRWLKGEWKPRTATCPAPPGAKRVEIREGIILSRDGQEWIHEERVEDVALPLYEGRMIGQFDYSQKGWVSGRGRASEWDHLKPAGKSLRPQFLMGLSDFPGGTPALVKRVGQMRVSSGTNTRTLICTAVPDLPCGDKVATLRMGDAASSLSLCLLLNSFVADYQTRMRIAGLQVDQHLLNSLVVPRPESVPKTAAFHAATLALANECFAATWLQLADLLPRVRESPWRTTWCLTDREIRSRRASLDAVAAWCYGIGSEDLRHILIDCDLPTVTSTNAKGFWRVDKGQLPETRQTVLGAVALRDLEDAVSSAATEEEGVTAFLVANDGMGWVVPESICLSEYGLGHDERAKRAQPVGAALGARFLDVQQGQEVEESWRECELHARNLLGEDGLETLVRGEEDRIAPGEEPRVGSVSIAPRDLSSLAREATGQTEFTFGDPERHERPPGPDEWDVKEVMCLFRTAARGRGAMPREELIKSVSLEMGYQRLGRSIEQALRNHLRTAIRRSIIGTDGDDVFLATPTMADYENGQVEEAVLAAMRLERPVDEEDVIRAVAEHFGFRRLADTVAAPIKRAISRRIRGGYIIRSGRTITRVG